jgi:hypothetical protein
MVPQINYELNNYPAKKRDSRRFFPVRPVIISYKPDRNEENLTTLHPFPPYTHTLALNSVLARNQRYCKFFVF